MFFFFKDRFATFSTLDFLFVFFLIFNPILFRVFGFFSCCLFFIPVAVVVVVVVVVVVDVADVVDVVVVEGSVVFCFVRFFYRTIDFR